MSKDPRKSMDDVVRELGRYPLDAFIFVQECIPHASEHAHGPLGEDGCTVARWMARHEMDYEGLCQAERDGKLPPEVRDALGRVGGCERMNRHVTGEQLCWAVRDCALQRWGLMARAVLGRWGMTCTEDIGTIVFALVDNDWLQKQPTDHIEDFEDVYDFAHAFDAGYQFTADAPAKSAG